MRILVATFGAASAVDTLESAIEMADERDAELLVVHTVPDEPAPTATAGVDDTVEHGHSVLDRAEQYAVDAGVSIETSLLRGDPSESISQYARDRQADLLVVGRPPDAEPTNPSSMLKRIVGRIPVSASIVPTSDSTERVAGERHRGDTGR